MPFWGEEISADKHAVVALDGPDVLVRLPVPEPELAVAVPGKDELTVGREARLDGVPGAQVALVLLPTLEPKVRPAESQVKQVPRATRSPDVSAPAMLARPPGDLNFPRDS